VREAARVARPGAALFVFTFSRRTLPDEARPVPGETFVFTQFSGEPQCFLTEAEILAEMESAGFVRDGAGRVTEYNRPRPGEIRAGGPPVIAVRPVVTRTPAEARSTALEQLTEVPRSRDPLGTLATIARDAARDIPGARGDDWQRWLDALDAARFGRGAADPDELARQLRALLEQSR